MHSNPANYPYGIYTIPEISFIGKTEEQLTDEDVPYEVGVAYYREIARGQIRGDTTGRLKLIFHRETREILGVHIIGEGACELLHIGQAVMILKGNSRLFRGHGLQLSDSGGVLQGGGIQRPEQAHEAIEAMKRTIGVLATRHIWVGAVEDDQLTRHADIIRRRGEGEWEMRSMPADEIAATIRQQIAAAGKPISGSQSAWASPVSCATASWKSARTSRR